MKIEIKIDSEKGEKAMTLSNNELSNFNFVEMWIEDVDGEYTVTVDDLEAIVAALKTEQKNTT